MQIEYDETFTQAEAPDVIQEYVCAVCHHDLEAVYLNGESRVFIVCPIHGSVCQVGRITRNTVSIEDERAHLQFSHAVLMLPDLWPEVLQAGMNRETAMKIQYTDVCAVGGETLMVYPTDTNFSAYEVKCRHHPGGGTIRKDKYAYNFQTTKAWEKNHKENRHADS